MIVRQVTVRQLVAASAIMTVHRNVAANAT
jgi:hypothetical protein